MSDDTSIEPSAEGAQQKSPEGRRVGVILCVVSAVATVAAVILVTGYLLFSGEADVRDIAPATGAISK